MSATPRFLTEEERLLLNYVLSHGNTSAQTFVSQVELTRAVPGCTCGCPSIGLVVDESATKGEAAERIIVDLTGTTPDGKGVGVIVFTDDGYLSDLEIYDFEGHTNPFPLPTIESLKPFAT